MNIPVAKPYLAEEEAKAAHDVVLTHWVTQGPRVQQFESDFCKYTGARYAVAVSNCTTALHLAMLVAGAKAGDEVICPSMSYVATANSIRYTGAKVVFAEVNPVDYNLDLDDVRKKITPNTKAILLVHQIGMPADIDSFKSLCAERNIQLIEDAACAAGSAYKGKKIGCHSSLVCFSFHPRKVITTGDGGMITTDNEEVYDRLRLLRQHGMSVNDRVRHESKTVIIEDHVELGYNYRLTDIQAAVGIEQLKRLDWLIAERRKIAMRYLSALADISFVRLPLENENCFSNYQSFSIYLHPNCPIGRNELMQRMLDDGIATRRGVMCAHRDTVYKDYAANYYLPISEDAADRSIIIPLYVPMNDNEVNYVIERLRHHLGC